MSNALLRDFRSQLRLRFAEDSEAMSYSDWITKNTSLRKKPFRFDGYEFQRAITDDMHPRLFVKKCSQVGLTEVQLRKFAAFLTRNVGVNGIFSLPDDNMFKRVSATRFKPMIEKERVFNLASGSAERPIRSVGLYQIGVSFGYFVGNKESDATSINADLLFHDELDLSDQEMIGLFQSRLQGSDWRITQNFSTPTFEGFGIDAGFKASDQHEYLCKCTKCNHWNLPEFSPKFIVIPGLSSDVNDLTDIDDEISERLDLENSYVKCESCGSRLNLGDPSLRQWVARYPGRRLRGYQVSPFCTDRLSVEYIVDQLLQYKRKDAIRRFHNTVLGQSYNDNNARISETDLRAVMKQGTEPEISEITPVFIGIDVGQTCHITLYAANEDAPVAFSWRQVPSENLVDEIGQLDKRYMIIGGAIDRYPYTPLANEIRDMTDGRIMPFEYATTASAAAIQLIRDELDNLSHIRINRTTALDQMATAIRKRKIVFAGYGQYEGLLILHFRDMVRVEKDDLSAAWQKLTGQDHFFHSGTLGLYAMRVADALNYRSDNDPRMMVITDHCTVSVPDGSQLGVNSRRRTAISLGAL